MVKVYTTPTCPACVQAKQFLDRKGVRYDEIDVARDRGAAEEMVRRSGQMGVPVIEIGGRMIVGFDADAIERAL